MMKRLILVLVLLLAPIAEASAAIAYVNSTENSNYGGGTTTTPSADAFSVSAGNLIVAAMRFPIITTESVTSVTDTAGNTYQAASGAADTTPGNDRIEIWYAMNTTANASNVITFHMSTGASFWSIVAAQYSGIATSSAFDAAASGEDGLGNTSVTSGAFSTAQADELIVGAAQSTGSGTWSAGTGLTNARVTDGDGIAGLADKIVSATQSSVTATMTSTVTNSKSIAVATFKAAAAASGAHNQMLLGAGN
jgi:hypothetical protein